MFRNSPQPVMHYALDLLARRPYSESELRGKLRKRLKDNEELEKLITRIKEMSLLNDAKYAIDYINSELRRAPQGLKMLKLRLQKKGFKPEDIEQALQSSPIDEFSLARTALTKKAKVVSKTDTRSYNQKLYRFLLSRGFSPSAAIKAVENLTGQETMLGLFFIRIFFLQVRSAFNFTYLFKVFLNSITQQVIGTFINFPFF
ncbi:MAG TPA: regulatory protein RecX [Candidatus Gracilibacteria bacterium]|nr:regulatory protein RecX [Candidatus Gracilibacteria bacterium]